MVEVELVPRFISSVLLSEVPDSCTSAVDGAHPIVVGVRHLGQTIFPTPRRRVHDLLSIP